MLLWVLIDKNLWRDCLARGHYRGGQDLITIEDGPGHYSEGISPGRVSALFCKALHRGRLFVAIAHGFRFL